MSDLITQHVRSLRDEIDFGDVEQFDTHRSKLTFITDDDIKSYVWKFNGECSDGFMYYAFKQRNIELFEHMCKIGGNPDPATIRLVVEDALANNSTVVLSVLKKNYYELYKNSIISLEDKSGDHSFLNVAARNNNYELFVEIANINPTMFITNMVTQMRSIWDKCLITENKQILEFTSKFICYHGSSKLMSEARFNAELALIASNRCYTEYIHLLPYVDNDEVRKQYYSDNRDKLIERCVRTHTFHPEVISIHGLTKDDIMSQKSDDIYSLIKHHPDNAFRLISALKIKISDFIVPETDRYNGIYDILGDGTIEWDIRNKIVNSFLKLTDDYTTYSAAICCEDKHREIMKNKPKLEYALYSIKL